MSARGFQDDLELGAWRPFKARVIGWEPEPEQDAAGNVAVSFDGAIRIDFAASPAQARAFAAALELAAEAAERDVVPQAVEATS